MDEQKVREEFDRRAALHGNLNAVLDATPGAHHEHANRWRDYVTRRVAARHVRPRADDVLLDLGCGVGRLSLHFAPHVKRVVGIDVSPAMIEVARREADRTGARNVEFHCAEAGSWPVPPGGATKALCFWTLSHVSDDSLPGVLTSVAQALAPGGRFLCFEQVRERPREEGAIHLQRTPTAYLGFFANAGLVARPPRMVLRYPSYALALWNRFRWLPGAALPLLAEVERLTVGRKPELADYYTCLFDVKRGD
jgi:SAM-dependent methyltransferase